MDTYEIFHEKNETPETHKINITKSCSNIDLSWSNITYEIKGKKVLDNIQGYALHGQLTAIMGSSGAGKTSLLNALSCRINKNWKSTISGSIYANEIKLTNTLFGKIAAYVMQQDILMETLTAKECFIFAANLKLELPYEERMAKVEEIISSLKLEKCQNTKIGNALEKGISGGEKRRVSIGVELISDPSILFLDEPTSGLDSFTSFIIISLLKKQCNLGRNIIFTIHQPSSDIFKLFDRIIFMSEGKIIYQGKSLESIPYFGELGFACPTYANPSDYLMEITHLETPKSEKDLEKIELFNKNYQEKNLIQVKKEMRK